jgi:hypothetical protein
MPRTAPDFGHVDANYRRGPARGQAVQPTVHVAACSGMAVARVGCCTPLLYGMTGASKNAVMTVLTSEYHVRFVQSRYRWRLRWWHHDFGIQAP